MVAVAHGEGLAAGGAHERVIEEGRDLEHAQPVKGVRG